jgi:hypothetical protein
MALQDITKRAERLGISFDSDSGLGRLGSNNVNEMTEDKYDSDHHRHNIMRPSDRSN